MENPDLPKALVTGKPLKNAPSMLANPVISHNDDDRLF